MCGVSGVYGPNALIKAFFMTLNMLERGRLGAGVAYTCNNELKILKEPIDPVEFFEKHYQELMIDVDVAISHNRQPSIGKVCYENTHPFLSCDKEFALIHNGTAVNHGLRKELIERGHVFEGETDSEVLTHVLEELFIEEGDMVKAIARLAEEYLSGSIIVLTRGGNLYAAKTSFQSLHYAEVDGEVYVASTSTAVKRLLDNMVFESASKKISIKELDDGCVLSVEDGKLNVRKCFKPKVVYYQAYYFDANVYRDLWFYFM